MSNSHGKTSGGYTPIKVLVGEQIRKLTPKECLRLMDFNDEDFYKIREINSDTQLYQQAGNSIPVNVVKNIIANLKQYL